MISVILETAPPHHCLRARGEFNLFNFSSKRTENHFSNYQNTNLFFLWDVSSGLKLCLWLKTLYIRRNLFKNKFFFGIFCYFFFHLSLLLGWQITDNFKLIRNVTIPNFLNFTSILLDWKVERVIKLSQYTLMNSNWTLLGNSNKVFLKKKLEHR